MPNRLAQETSPYLLQHANNPVDWYAWGPEAFERAKREDKPILLSIGYAACHWCHVMERESFSNAAIAELLNRHFVCIKVDREERPDLDEIYMSATVALSGSGGWPMTVFLTPDQRPFFAGTYFPPVDRHGRPGFTTLLERLADLWKNDRATLLRQAEELTRAVQRDTQGAAAGPVSGDALDAAVAALAGAFDQRFGGFGKAPKFPPCSAIELLLRHYQKTRDERSLEMATKTLDGMKNGGIFDHLGGGFARYSVDERWHVPHFEKMLYDNAELSRVYLAGYQLTGHPEYATVARRTLDFVAREMQAPEGGYYSSFDADSEGEEGKFYVWRRDELDTVLDREAAEAFALYYDVTHEGNWEGKNVLWQHRGLEHVARELGMAPERLAQTLEASRRKLYEARKARVAPLCDDKIVTAWNGLMIGAMAEGARVLGDPRYLESAERAARFALQALRRPDNGLFRTARGGRAHLDGYLEDYAFLADGLITLYEAGADFSFLKAALELAERLLADFGDEPDAAFFHTAKRHEPLITRLREGHDGAVPNPNSVAARALARLAVHFERPELAERAAAALRFYGALVDRAPRSFLSLLNSAEFLLAGPVELVFAGRRAERAPLERAVASYFLPNRVVAFVDPERPEPERALTAGKSSGSAALYVCRDFTCQAPVTNPDDVAAALLAHRKEARRRPRLEPPRLPGRATEAGTLRLAARFQRPDGAYTKLGKTSLHVSRLGYGTYRLDGRPAHRAALARALENGINLIDTSTNYTDGSSERAIGSVLAELVRNQKLARDELVVVSKVGYVQGKSLELARARKNAGKPYPEMVEFEGDLWHCVHPEWIADELTASLARLGLETLDVLLLHNPEYFLREGVRAGRGTLEELREAFYLRIEAAFAHLEQEVKNGRIAYYGVSSNTAAFPGDQREATNLARFLEVARKVGGAAHHFRVLELPFNLLEAGAHLETGTGFGKSVLDFAADEGVAVLTNRPLNAFNNDTLERLVDAPIVSHALMFDFARNQVAALEREFCDTLAPSLKVSGDEKDPSDLFSWADHLTDIADSVKSFQQWRDLEERVIRPQVGRLLAAFDNAELGELEPIWQSFRDRYIPALDQFLTAIRAEAAEISRARDTRLHAALDSLLPVTLRALTLAQKALYVTSSVRGVSSVLVGARKDVYVDDLIRVLNLPPLEAELASQALRAVVQQGA